MTFDDYRNDRSIPQTAELATPLLDNHLDENFSNLLLFQAQLKIMHWGTDSYAEHNAYGSTYSDIDDGLDALVESYQGYHGRIDFGLACEFISFSKVEPNSWLNSMIVCLNNLRAELRESDLQNLTDELIASVSKLKYLLTLK